MSATEAQLHECDVLIIGGGIAGAYAAIRAKDFTDKVILVEKAKVSRSGPSTFAAGVILCPMKRDNFDLWVEEIVERGEYIADQEWVEITVREMVDRIMELDQWGAGFEKDENGKIVRTVGRAHVNTRLAMFHAKSLMEAMRKRLIQRGITLVERVNITDLLTEDGYHPTKSRVIGAVGFHTRSGERHVFKAKAVIIASGGTSFKNSEMEDGVTGSGIAQAFRAGAEITGMEFKGVRDGWCFEHKYWCQGMNMYQSAGIILTNAKGERFMAKNCPELKERAGLRHLALAFNKELYEGRGPVYADLTHISPETEQRFRRVLPWAMTKLDRAGINLCKQKPVFDVPSQNIRGMPGGVRHNIYCETSLPGLYAAGQAGGFPAHGSYSVGGVNLATSAVSGYRAGEYAAKYAQQAPEVKLNRAQVNSRQQAAFRSLQVKGKVTFDDIVEMLQELISPAGNVAFRHEKRLKKVLSRLEEIRGLLAKVPAPDFHELVKVHEANDYIQCVELVLRASLERKESRGECFREDYPYRDDRNWLKWIVLWRENDGILVKMVPIPLYRYPVRPDKYEEKIPLSTEIPKIESNSASGGQR